MLNLLESLKCYATPGTVTVRNGYTASELASMALPGWPTTRKNWYVRARGWPFVERAGKGPGGIVRAYIVPPEVQALIDARKGCEAATDGLAGHREGDERPSDERLLRSPARPEYAVNMAFRGGFVDAELLARVAGACSVVHGPDFDQVGLPHQVQAVGEVYNVLLSLASHLPGGPESLRQLDQAALVAQIRVLLQMGALKPSLPAQSCAK